MGHRVSDIHDSPHLKLGHTIGLSRDSHDIFIVLHEYANKVLHCFCKLSHDRTQKGLSRGSHTLKCFIAVAVEGNLSDHRGKLMNARHAIINLMLGDTEITEHFHDRRDFAVGYRLKFSAIQRLYRKLKLARRVLE